MPTLGICFSSVDVMAASASQEGVESIRSLAAASHSLDRDEARQVHRLCEIAKQALKDINDRFVASAEHTPILQTCSGDGTPIQVSEQATICLQQGHIQRRHGKTSHEFLVCVMFNRYLCPEGKAKTSILFRDPTPLTNGKKSLQLFESMRAQWKTQTTGSSGLGIAALHL